jgi:hypothetical protein
MTIPAAPFDPELVALNHRYHAAAHGVQSAIAFEINTFGDKAAGADHKHLRVGLSMTLVDSSSIAMLLMQKGLITEREYLEAIALGAEAELARVTAALQSKTGIAQLRFG